MKARNPCKTPRRLSFSERELRILDAAIELFSKNGFKGTTTRAIAQHAGVNEALLFRHFKNKEEMYCALLKKKLTDFESEFIPSLNRAKHKPLEKALVEIAHLLIDKNRRDPAFFRMMLFSSLENHELSRIFLQQRPPLVVFLEDYFKEKIRAGALRLQNPGVLSQAFLSLVYHYVLVSQIFQAPELYPVSETALMQKYVSIFMRGILA